MRGKLYGRVAMLGVAPLLPVRAGLAVCSSTPAAAVSLLDVSGVRAIEGGDGYRVTSVRWDPVLRQEWAMVARCGHPEWPEIALPTPVPKEGFKTERRKMVASSAGTPLMVRAGDTVWLWRRENELRIELAAVAEESGGVGKSIRVRIVHAGVEDQVEREMVGVVRGPADVEMQR
jgi:hypothetical protein